MADENLDMESVRISELDQTTEVDREKDYLVVSRHSDAYIDDEKSFKITPDDLLAGVGVNYTAGAHIAIDNNTHTISATYTNATTSADGLMSKEDKSTVDSLQPVATSGDYNDLTNKPTIPAAQVNSDWNSNSGVSEILNKPTLATVATTGDYADLSNTPTIPDAISDLTDDVSITNPENDEVLKYDATSSKWVNAAAPAGASALSGLTDVAISTPLNNQALLYDNTTHTWINKAVEGTVPVKDTASGQIATFETNLVAPLQSVLVNVVATGGNGTPDNPNPINGYSSANITRCGVNLWGGETMADAFANESGYSKNTTTKTFTFKNAPTSPYNDIIYDKFNPSTQYTLILRYTADANNNSLRIDYTDETNTVINLSAVNDKTDYIVTTTSGKSVKSISLHYYGNGTVTVYYDESGLFEGVKTVDDFAPYNGQTYTIAFGQTVYGGVPDVTRGKLHVTKGFDDLGDLSWTRWTNDSAYYIFYATLADKENTENNTGICSSFPILATNATGAVNAKGLLNTDNEACLSVGTSTPYIFVRCDTYTDASAFKTAMSGQKLVYELATPFDIDITQHQIEALLGINNVWHDANGDTEVKYYTSTAKDIKDFIETSIDVDDLANVDITTPSENQVLKYNGSQWVNATSPAGATNLDGLTDVTITTPTAGQALVYNGTSSEWENKAVDYANIANKPTLSTVATSGSYTDLSNTPTIPAAQVNADWDSTSGVSEILNKPTIPTVNDATITVVQGSTTKGTFTLNQSTNATITLDAGGSGGASALDDLTDVDITTPTDGQTLVYDGTNSKWINGAGGGGSAKQTAITQAEYNALVQAGTVDPTMEYFITDGIPYSIAPWTDITATLTAGQTSLVFSNVVITTNSTIDIYVDDSFYGVNPTSVTLATGSVTLTFDEQESNMPVKVRVS